MLLSIQKPGITRSPAATSLVLAGDVGASKTNMGIFRVQENKVTSVKEAGYRTSDYKNILELTDSFVTDKHKLNAVCFGVAGPVMEQRAKLSNVNWEITVADLTAHFESANVYLINDLEATAYGISLLTTDELVVINEGNTMAVGNAAVIAPGTGLGEAGLFWDGKYHYPFATEGGHCDFAQRNSVDVELYTFLQKKYGHVSRERVASGQGITNIFMYLSEVKNKPVPQWLSEKLQTGDDAAVISSQANENETCMETMQLFVRYLAEECANLALKYKATGGVFIGGGIAPKTVSLINTNTFRSAYLSNGRLNNLLAQIPVSIILNPKIALSGAALFAGMACARKVN